LDYRKFEVNGDIEIRLQLQNIAPRWQWSLFMPWTAHNLNWQHMSNDRCRHRVVLLRKTT
jgi:hypothetical protein